MKEIFYDRVAAVLYAQEWALKRNKSFYDFENIGGDCTNFASQCIYAGAKIMNYKPIFGWYYNSLSSRTPSWSGVEYLYNFLVSNGSVGPFGHEVSQNKVQPGDIVQLGRHSGGYYHSPVITSLSPEILVCAHSFDALNRPLSSYIYDKARFIHIDGVRIT